MPAPLNANERILRSCFKRSSKKRTTWKMKQNALIHKPIVKFHQKAERFTVEHEAEKPWTATPKFFKGKTAKEVKINLTSMEETSKKTGARAIHDALKLSKVVGTSSNAVAMPSICLLYTSDAADEL